MRPRGAVGTERLWSEPRGIIYHLKARRELFRRLFSVREDYDQAECTGHLTANNFFIHFFSKKYGGRGASGRRGDRPTTCTVPEASQERVRYASAPGCPGHGRASCALTDLHTHHRQRRSAGTLKCTVLYTYDELPPRVAGYLRGIHNRTRLRRRIDAGGPLTGPPRDPALREA